MISQTASEEMYLRTVEEESGDESMLMGGAVFWFATVFG